MADFNVIGAVKTAFSGANVSLDWTTYVYTGQINTKKAYYMVWRDGVVIMKLAYNATKAYTDSTVASGRTYIYSVTFRSR